MADGHPYIVIEADYLDQQDGIVPGRAVIAEPGALDGQLLVVSIEGKALPNPVAVYADQLHPAEEDTAAA